MQHKLRQRWQILVQDIISGGLRVTGNSRLRAQALLLLLL